MPSLLRYRKCGVCSHEHNFSLIAGEVARGEVFAFVCPRTGRRGLLRADAPGEPARFAMQGAVQLERPGDDVRKAA